MTEPRCTGWRPYEQLHSAEIRFFQKSSALSVHPDPLYSGGTYYFKDAASFRGTCTLLIAEKILAPTAHILFQTLLQFTEQTCYCRSCVKVPTLFCKPLWEAQKSKWVTWVTASPSKQKETRKHKGREKELKIVTANLCVQRHHYNISFQACLEKQRIAHICPAISQWDVHRTLKCIIFPQKFSSVLFHV